MPCDFLDVFFPVSTVEGADVHVRQDIVVQTTKIDVDSIGVGTGDIEGLNPTVPTEMVLGRVGTEGIG